MSKRKSTTEIIIHCSATFPDMDIGRAEIDQWHKQRGWRGIGYHYVIRRDGTLEVGRDELEVGAHAKGHNGYSIGICMVGGINKLRKPMPNFTAIQWTALLDLIDNLISRYPSAAVIGHNEISNKACPSFDVQAWLNDVLIGYSGPTEGKGSCPVCGQKLPG